MIILESVECWAGGVCRLEGWAAGGAVEERKVSRPHNPGDLPEQAIALLLKNGQSNRE